MAGLVAFALVLLLGCGAMARSLDHGDSVLSVVSGTLYALEPLNGQTQHRLHRRHLDAMSNSHVQTLRLDLGPEVAAIDMELSQDSVWTDDSRVVVRRGEQVEEVHDVVDSSCFLSGRLTSHSGAASLNRCGRLTGMIDTVDVIYEIEEHEDGDQNSELFNVKVTMSRSDDMTSATDEIVLTNQDSFDSEGDEIKENLSKREIRPVTAEVAITLDANFARYMTNNRSMSQATLTQWLINKWNTIRNVLGNVPVIGFPFIIELKKIEIWWTNPERYERLGNAGLTKDYLQVFCRGLRDNENYDHRMIYTQGTGIHIHHMGMAPNTGICDPDNKCSLVKGKKDGVKIELHEIGHNMGLKHDPWLPNCTDTTGNGGFMAWGRNYDYLDCYRTVLLRKIRLPELSCLYERNVNRPVLNQ